MYAMQLQVDIVWFNKSLNTPGSILMVESWSSEVDARLAFSPDITGWKIDEASAEQSIRKGHIYDLSTGNKTTKMYSVIDYRASYSRSYSTILFALMIIALMWIMSVYLLALSIDHMVFRPRRLQPDTVSYSVGMLFALPTMRMLLPTPLGSTIDFVSFFWNMLLVAVAVIIFFSGSYTGELWGGHSWRIGLARKPSCNR
jgi:hypothetical protein